MASIRRRRNKSKGYEVRWQDPEVWIDDHGLTQRRWRSRSRACPDMATAKTLAREIEGRTALGERWEADSEQALITLDTLGLAYVRAAVDAGAPLATQRFRSSMIDAFLRFAGRETAACDLSLSLLDRYAASLPALGRQAATRYPKLLEVERMWAWAADRPESYPGVPPPRRMTGRDLQPPPPVVASAAPTWAEVDRMISHLDRRPWHRQLALILRYTGLRCSQGLSLDWRDVELERGFLRVRAGVRGAKKGRTRVVPLHPALAEELRRLGPGEGLVLRRPDGRPWRSDAPVEPFRRAWKLAEVPVAKWGVAETRASPASGPRAGRPMPFGRP